MFQLYMSCLCLPGVGGGCTRGCLAKIPTADQTSPPPLSSKHQHQAQHTSTNIVRGWTLHTAAVTMLEALRAILTMCSVHSATVQELCLEYEMEPITHHQQAAQPQPWTSLSPRLPCMFMQWQPPSWHLQHLYARRQQPCHQHHTTLCSCWQELLHGRN